MFTCETNEITAVEVAGKARKERASVHPTAATIPCYTKGAEGSGRRGVGWGRGMEEWTFLAWIGWTSDLRN